MSDLSWLNPTPHAIAVYASQPLSPVATQHSLPSRRYSLLGPDFHRQDRTSFAWRTQSITSSASRRNDSKIESPSVLAVLRLTRGHKRASPQPQPAAASAAGRAVLCPGRRASALLSAGPQ